MSFANLKPIETRYKGYRFRSRLEARWACFFDALPIRWEYEFEGIDCGELGYYLPDFWLPEFDCFFEVKYACSALTQNDVNRMACLADTSRKQVMAFYECSPADLVFTEPGGGPNGDAWHTTGFGHCMGLDGRWQNDIAFGFCDVCHRPTLGFLAAHWTTGSRDGMCPGTGFDEMALNPKILRAFAAARSARFEHGKSVDPWKNLR